MATYTTAASGNTNVGSTWIGGSVPPIDGVTGAIAYGHQIVIANAHTLTNPAGVKFWPGTSPGTDDHTVPAIAPASAFGTGIFINNGDFRYRGPVNIGVATWQMANAGANCTHDSSGATTPASTHYSVHVGTGGDQARVSFNGVAGNRAVVNIAPGSGAAGGFPPGSENGSYRNGQIVATYASFSDIGTATLPLVNACLHVAGDSCTFDNCLLDRCGRISVAVLNDGTNYRFKNSSFRSPVDSSGYAWGFDGNGNGATINPTGGDRRVENAYMEGCLNWYATTLKDDQTGLHLVNDVLCGTSAIGPIGVVYSAKAAECTNVLLYNHVAGTGGGAGLTGGLSTRIILLRDNGAAGNPHIIAAIKGAITVDGYISELGGTGGLATGDVFQTEPSTVHTFACVFKHGLDIPDRDGNASGTRVNHSINGIEIDNVTYFGPQVTFEHHTGLATPGGGVGGENNHAYAGMFQSVRANLAWLAANGAGELTTWQTVNLPVAGSYQQCDYNGFYNVTGRYAHTSDDPTAYQNPAPPGTHDVTLTNPNFVDPTRKFLTWAQSVDASVTSWADAINRFSKMNDDAGVIAGFTVSAAYDWIRAGWVPRNTAANASYPGDAEQFLGFTAAVPLYPNATPTAKSPTKVGLLASRNSVLLPTSTRVSVRLL